jgi:hypothetical protein
VKKTEKSLMKKIKFRKPMEKIEISTVCTTKIDELEMNMMKRRN